MTERRSALDAELESREMIQFDDRFENEFLQSNVPFHDFSFLKNLVAVDDETAHEPSIASPLLSDLGDHEEQVSTSSSKSTSIPPYSTTTDRISGLDSLRPDSSVRGPAHHIPTGLFINIGASHSGFLGK
jgi:hypothetical protein